MYSLVVYMCCIILPWLALGWFYCLFFIVVLPMCNQKRVKRIFFNIKQLNRVGWSEEIMITWYLIKSMTPLWLQKWNYSELLVLITSLNYKQLKSHKTRQRSSASASEFPSQRPATWSFDVFLDLRLNKRLSKHSWGWWSETPSR